VLAAVASACSGTPTGLAGERLCNELRSFLEFAIGQAIIYSSCSNDYPMTSFQPAFMSQRFIG
jgi:hypothetical protein